MTQFMVEAACPKCHRSESWSVWIGTSGQPMGTCHRALCSHGSRQLNNYEVFPSPKKKEPRHYTRPITTLTDEQYFVVRERFGINPNELEGYNEIDDRFILGVYGPVGYNKRGSIAYSLSGSTPKSLTYNEKPDEPWMHWAGTAGDIVIVEDWFSAEKVFTAGATGAAIFGTNLDQGKVTELSRIASDRAARVYIALDRDAFHKTMAYVAKFREQFPLGLYAWSLRVDLKYESTQRIKRALDGATDFSVDVTQPERA